MQNRRKFLLQSGMAATAILATRPFESIASVNQRLFPLLNGNNNLTILHTNDICNCLNPVPSFAGLGGFRQTATVIRAIQKDNSRLLLLDAGNSFSGKKADKSDHKETLSLMNSLRYDAVLPGHRDLKSGTAYLQEQLVNYSIPAVASNYALNDSGLGSAIQSYKIIKKGKIRVGIIGAGNTQTAEAGIGFINPVKEANRLAAFLKKEEGCHLVICLSQLGYKNRKVLDDISLARQSKHIDMILGGNSRTFMQQPMIVLNKMQEEVIINHAAHSGIVLGQIEIGFDEHNRKRTVAFSNRMIGTSGLQWKDLSA
jgi:5'-nucleotidase